VRWDLPGSDDEEAFALLDEAVLGEVLDFVAHVVPCVTDVMKQHVEVGLMLLVRRETEGLLESCNSGLNFLQDGSDGVDGFKVGLVIRAIASTATC